MEKSKKQVVSQEGAQSLSATYAHDSMLKESAVSTKPKVPFPAKKGATFSLDPETCNRFKAACAQQGRTMSSVVEELISEFVNNTKQI